MDMLEGFRACPRSSRPCAAPFLATLLGIVVVAVGVPVNGGLVITGGILRFLPTAGLVAGMRDLIDQSIISGSARLAEALLLASAVGIGTALAIQVGVALGGPRLVLPSWAPDNSAVVEVVAAAHRRQLLRLPLGSGPDSCRPSSSSARWRGSPASRRALQPRPRCSRLRRRRSPSALSGRRSRTGSDCRPSSGRSPRCCRFLPGLAMVDGILRISTIEGVVTLVGAVATGFALGAGVAFGGILVATAVQVREGFLEPIVLEPVTAAITSGIGRVARVPADRGGGEERPGAG